MEVSTYKKQLLIRMPRELAECLENRVKEIGISRQAFVLGLIYKELKKESGTIYVEGKPAKTAV